MTTVSGHRHPAAMIARRASGCPHGWPRVPRLAQALAHDAPARGCVGLSGYHFVFYRYNENLFVHLDDLVALNVTYQ
jgi:hypothetical protein